MAGDRPARTFISYSRKDGAGFAADLRKILEAENLSVWHDIVALEGGVDWWSQIEDALKSKTLQHFILVITPGSLASREVRREIRLARQEGKTVCPIKGPGLINFAALPRWIGQIYDLDVVEHKTTLIRVLQGESRQKRVPMMAPEPPSDFVKRPQELDALKARLLDAKGDAAAAFTAALRGAGGYGKTTLAKALADDPDIQDAYFDGILWAELGEKPERLLATLFDLIVLLTGERPALETVHAAAAKLGEALGDRRILLIVDDAWREQDLRPFLQGGPRAVRLVTTRIDSVLPQTASRQLVDAMQAGEALRLLSGGLPADQVKREDASLAKLAARLGNWAQLLKIVNGFLRDRVVNGRQPLREAIASANKRLDAKGVVAFDPSDETDRAKAVARAIGVSLELLSETERMRFGELGVFPEDAEIPVGVTGRLWATTGGLDDFETEDLLSRLFDLSLLLDLDLGQRFFQLHDTVRHFIRDRAGKERLVAQHRKLVAALDGVASAATDARTRRYYYLHLPHHLAEAQEREKLDALLLEPGWLEAKLEATANPQALVADYQLYGSGEAHSLIGRTLRLLSGICARDGRQLLPQLIGRLAGFQAAVASGFLKNARLLVPRPAIVPLRPTLTAPGAETARLEGDSEVCALCRLPDDSLASGFWDGTIRLWDVTTGVEIARLDGHDGGVEALCVLPDGRLASGSRDGTIRLWDMTTGGAVARLEGHDGSVEALCVLPDGRLASGSGDSTIRLWDITTGAAVTRLDLEEHDGGAEALCVLPDGRLASGPCWYGTIRLWDVTTGAETTRLEGHTSGVNALCGLPDGRLASGSPGDGIRLWDVTTGAETVGLDGNTDKVIALCLLPDGRLASSHSGTIVLWDVTTGAETAYFHGHSGAVTALCPLPDGRLASGSRDKTIRLWDVTTHATSARFGEHRDIVTTISPLLDGGLASSSFDNTIRLWDVTGAETARLEGHTDHVSTLCLLPDGRLASGSRDSTIRLWDVTAGAQSALLEGHSRGVEALCGLPDGRLASGGWDKMIRLWDVTTGAETARLQGHSSRIDALCGLSDGRLASGSWDKTIRLWDVTTRAETARLELGVGATLALCLLSDGRLASGSSDSTIRLWDITTGAEVTRLKGHTQGASALCLLPDGRLVSGSWDNTIRIWNLAAGTETTGIEIDAPVRAIVAVAPNLIVANDDLGLLHWLEVVD
jgi:WD40 repeat protein